MWILLCPLFHFCRGHSCIYREEGEQKGGRDEGIDRYQCGPIRSVVLVHYSSSAVANSYLTYFVPIPTYLDSYRSSSSTMSPGCMHEV